jgi:hypothetical protein
LWDKMPCSRSKVNELLEEHVASIFSCLFHAQPVL